MYMIQEERLCEEGGKGKVTTVSQRRPRMARMEGGPDMFSLRNQLLPLHI